MMRYEVTVEGEDSITDTQSYEQGVLKVLLKGDDFFKGMMENSKLMIQTDIEGT